MSSVDYETLYRQLSFLEGERHLLDKVTPLLQELIVDLSKLPGSVNGLSVLPLFRRCMLKINDYEEEIETVERDSLLDVIYRLGELVGLSRESEFAEEWRGDW